MLCGNLSGVVSQGMFKRSGQSILVDKPAQEDKHSGVPFSFIFRVGVSIEIYSEGVDIVRLPDIVQDRCRAIPKQVEAYDFVRCRVWTQVRYRISAARSAARLVIC